MEKSSIPVRLVLSGGGTRGFAHLGMISAMLELGFVPEAYCGSSAGAVAAAFLCAGYHPEEVLSIFLAQKPLSLASLALNEGLLSTRNLDRFLEKMLPATFDKLQLPLAVVATDLNSGTWQSFTSGNLNTILTGSCAIPGLIKPVVFGKMLLADGGILNNLPVEAIPPGIGLIAGLHVNPVAEVNVSASAFRILERTFHLGVYSNTIARINKCDCFIEPLPLAKFRVFDFTTIKDVYQIGYDFVKQDAQRIVAELT